MLLAVRLAALFALLLAFSVLNAKEIHVLVVGEGAASNCNAKLFSEVRGVYQIGLDGVEKPARDPFDWSACKGGSVWIPLGQAMIKAGMTDKVIFMPIGVEYSRARDWLVGGSTYRKLRSAFYTINAQNIKFDYALWQQGPSDFVTDRAVYFNDLRKVMRDISLNISIGKWIVALSADCAGNSAVNITAAQAELARNPVLNRYKGPDTGLLRSRGMLSQCNFTEPGQQLMARLWLESMLEAKATSVKYQKESLLYYFK